MGYAVELYFDEQLDRAVRSLRAGLHGFGVPALPGSLSARPHISLALLPEGDTQPFVRLLESFAAHQATIAVRFSAVAAFPTPENVLFLAPSPSRALLAAHRAFHERLKAAGIRSEHYYQPDRWFPHCTIEMEIPDSLFPDAFSYLKSAFKPLNGRLVAVGLTQYRPLKDLFNIPLRGDA